MNLTHILLTQVSSFVYSNRIQQKFAINCFVLKDPCKKLKITSDMISEIFVSCQESNQLVCKRNTRERYVSVRFVQVLKMTSAGTKLLV